MFFRIPNRFSPPAEHSAPDCATTEPVAAPEHPQPHPSGLPAARQFFSSLSHTGALQTVARGVLSVWLAPVVFTLLASFVLAGKPIPSQAQNAGQTVIVLDFAVQTGMEP